MKVRIQFAGQLRRYAGTDGLEWDCDPDTTLSTLFADLADRSDATLRTFLVDDAGERRGSLVVAVNGTHLAGAGDRTLEDGDEVLLLSPVAGG